MEGLEGSVGHEGIQKPSNVPENTQKEGLREDLLVAANAWIDAIFDPIGNVSTSIDIARMRINEAEQAGADVSALRDKLERVSKEVFLGNVRAWIDKITKAIGHPDKLLVSKAVSTSREMLEEAEKAGVDVSAFRDELERVSHEAFLGNAKAWVGKVAEAIGRSDELSTINISRERFEEAEKAGVDVSALRDELENLIASK